MYTAIKRVLATAMLNDQEIRRIKQSATALLLATLIMLGTLIPTASAIAATNTANVAQEPDPSSLSLPTGLPVQASETKPAADAKGQNNAMATAGTVLNQSSATQSNITRKELVDKRTAVSDVTRNSNGSLTEKRYMTPKYYKQGKDKAGKDVFTKIDTTLIEDKNAGDSGTAIGRAYGAAKSLVSSETTFKVKSNGWLARFGKSDSAKGMVRVQEGDNQLGFKPVNAKAIDPVITTTKDGIQTVHYYDLWKGIDVEYLVDGESVKENIIIKNKDAMHSVSFEIIGAALEADGKTWIPSAELDVKDTKQPEAAHQSFKLKGALKDVFSIAAPNLMLNNFGLITNGSGLQQTYKNGILTVGIDKMYLQKLPAKAFPAVIDPTTTRQSEFGNRIGGNYMSFKSDGYVCYSDVCNVYAGSLMDSSGIWRSWRGVLHSPYDFVKGKRLDYANLHLKQRSNESFWTGTWDQKSFTAWRAECGSFHYCNRQGTQTGGTVGSDGNINVTDIYRNAIAENNWGIWLMITGQEENSTTYKNFDPQGSYVEFTYADILPSPTVISPVASQSFIDPQVSFSSTAHNSPVTNAPLKYKFCVSTAPGCAGAVMISSDETSPQWTMPDNILQDGNTYYVQAQTYDSSIPLYSPYGASVAFKIDMRTGKDNTQAYDALGPVNVNLATGNVSTSTTSHTSAALGGSLGVSLDYNSPVRSRNGLVGEYFNNTSWSGAPALTRVDQKVDFLWQDGSPSSNVVNTDNFSARWSGYFVAPKTGDYSFGAINDDGYTITVNNQAVYTNSYCWPSACYGSTVRLNEGQVVPIAVTLIDGGGWATSKLYVKGPVSEQIVPSAWLQTGARKMSQQQGLTGKYYRDTGSHSFTDGANTMYMQRTDPLLSFAWESGATVPGGPTDNFMTRWTGYLTVPATGSYQLGSVSDDGTRVTIGANNAVAFDKWRDDGNTELYGGDVLLTAGQSVPITVDYFENGGGATMYLKIKSTALNLPAQVVPSAWLSPNAQTLPAGWNLGIDADGNISYDHLKSMGANVLLTDSSGSTHEYIWTGGAYKAPVNEDGKLTKNGDNTHTLEDIDGRTYIFNTDGTLMSVTSTTDDLKPAALKYVYGGTPAKLIQITDGTDVNRWAKVYYSGSAECGALPIGFDNAPANMLCAVKTDDNRATYFYYKQGNLSRINKPGNEATDYQYDSLGRIIAIRDATANDLIANANRANDATVLTELGYDTVGRLGSVKQPGATAAATRIVHSLEYLPGTGDGTNGTSLGVTRQHVTPSGEPNGFARKVEYDNLYRTIKDTDAGNLATVTTYDPLKDLAFSTTSPLGMKSTIIYDDVDRPTDSYGPAPTAWFGADRKPLSTYVSQTPHSSTAYDEGIKGLAVAYFAYSPTSKSLIGTPKLHSTGLANATGTDATSFNKYYGTASPVPGQPNDWGLRATGKMRLPATGSYNFRLFSDNGVRLYIDDELVLDDWNDRVQTSHPSVQYYNTAGSVHRITIEYYHLGGDSNIALYLTPPGQPEVSQGINQWFSPDYGLTTSTKTFDAQIGDTTTTTNYGANPELGLAKSTSLDPTGLNLTSSATYEAQGAANSYLRQTNKTLPGGSTSTYGYYSSGEKMDNPCTTPVDAAPQGAMIKLRTEADPDGTGAQTARTTAIIYDAAGRLVATRVNADAWTCTSYDTRGRVIKVIYPAVQGRQGRILTYAYTSSGNPLYLNITDSVTGSSRVEYDLLGRTVKLTDTFGFTVLNTYETGGKLVKQVSQKGTEEFGYDTLGRTISYKLDGIIYAKPVYDSYNRITSVTYPEAKAAGGTTTLALTAPVFDALGRGAKTNYKFSDGSLYSEQVTRSTSGKVTAVSDTVGAKTAQSKYTYDKAGRLTSATVDNWKLDYGFSTPEASCTSKAGYNAKASLSGNRSSYRVTNTLDTAVTSNTTYCYDQADRLTYASDANIGAPTYDDHGNIKAFGGNGTPLQFEYDSRDQNIGMTQGTNKTTYVKNIDGVILSKNIYKNGVLDKAYRYAAGGAVTMECSVTNTSACSIAEKNIDLIGDVNLTLMPNETDLAKKASYAIKNFHGDTIVKANANGLQYGGITIYDPFGSLLESATFNQASDFMVGGDSSFTLNVKHYGVRTYIAELGRFLQVDPVEGGTDNAYAYVNDPINSNDYSGKFSFTALLKKVVSIVVRTTVKVAINVIKFSAAVGEHIVQAAVGVKTAAVAVYRAGAKFAAGAKEIFFPTNAAAPKTVVPVPIKLIASKTDQNDFAKKLARGDFKPYQDRTPYGGLAVKDPVAEFIKQNPADAASMIPGYGVPFDVYTTARDCKSKFLSIACGASMIGFIPFVGDTAKTGIKSAQFCAKNCESFYKALKYSEELSKTKSKQAAEAAMKSIREAEHTGYKIPNLASASGLAPKLLTHVLDGDVSDGAHYMHSIQKNFSINYLMSPADAYGATVFKININGQPKTSTFFPPSYDASEIALAGKQAMANQKLSNDTKTYIGYDNKNLPIGIQYDSSMKPLTFFPIHQNDLPGYIN